MKKIWGVLVLAVLAVVAVSTFAVAEDNAEAAVAANDEWIQGTLKVEKNAEGVVTAAYVEALDLNANGEAVKVRYNLVLDEHGKNAADLTGKEVEVVGALVNKGTDDKPDFWVTARQIVAVGEAVPAVN